MPTREEQRKKIKERLMTLEVILTHSKGGYLTTKDAAEIITKMQKEKVSPELLRVTVKRENEKRKKRFLNERFNVTGSKIYNHNAKKN